MDYVRLKNLVFFAHHGVLPVEAKNGQRFEVDIELAGDLSQTGQQDDLNLTFDYDRIYSLVKEVVTERRFNLIEAVAEAICDNVLDAYPEAQVKVVVRKPQAPLSGLFDCAEVEIQRGPRLQPKLKK